MAKKRLKTIAGAQIRELERKMSEKQKKQYGLSKTPETQEVQVKSRHWTDNRTFEKKISNET